jgi:hypothetical protein
MLTLSHTPRRAWDDLLMARSKQQQRRQHGSTKGLLDPSLVLTALVLASPEVRLQLAIALVHGPPSLRRTPHRSRDPLVQSGPQDFRRFGAAVPPLFPQPHGDVAAVPQTPACALHPAGCAARGAREAGHPRALRIGARPRRHHVLARWALDRVPRPRHGAHQAPRTSRSVGVARHDPLPLVWRARGGIARDDDPLRPGGRAKASSHRTQQRLVRLIRRMACGPQQTKGPWHALRIPVGEQQRQADAEKPGVLCPVAPCVGQGMLGTPRRLVPPVTHERQVPVAGRRQGVAGVLHPPSHQDMDRPRARLAQTAQAPDRELGGRPSGECFQGFPSRLPGWPVHKPTQDEAMTAVPDPGPSAPPQRDAQGHRGDRDQSQPHRAQGVSDQGSGMPAVLCSHRPLAIVVCTTYRWLALRYDAKKRQYNTRW